MTEPNFRPDAFSLGNQSAYPRSFDPGTAQLTQIGGLTKREWFLGMVLNGLCSNPELIDDLELIDALLDHQGLSLVEKIVDLALDRLSDVNEPTNTGT